MFWFVYQNRCNTRSEIPIWLTFFGEKLKLVFCLCFTKDEKLSDLKEENLDSSKPVLLGVHSLNTKNNEESSQNVKENRDDKNKEKKCRLCNRCKDCEKDFKKDEEKKKKKKAIEETLENINYFIFIINFICMLTTQLAIWLSLAT